MATLAELTAQIQALDAAADASYAAVQAVRNVTPPNVQADLVLVAKAKADLDPLMAKILEAEGTYPASVPTFVPLRDKLKAHYLELKDWETELKKLLGQPIPMGPTPVSQGSASPPPASRTQVGPNSVQVYPQAYPVPVLPDPMMYVPPAPTTSVDLSPVLVPFAGGLIGYLVRQTPVGAAVGALAGIAYEVFVRRER